MSLVPADLRTAARSLARRPGFTLVVLATLTIGIGATTAIFSVVNAVMLRPLPFADPDRLVMVAGTDARLGNAETRLSYPDFRDVREGTSSFESLAALWSFPNGDVNLTGGIEPERVPVARVTAGFFELLGVRLAHGRDFLPEENVVGNHRVAILSHRLWQRLYGADPALVGRAVQVNGFPYTVVGILPPGFRAHGVLGPEESVELWRPLAPDDNQTGGRGSRNLRVVGRLRGDATVERARREVAAVADRLAEAYPQTNEGLGATVIRLHEQAVRSTRPALLLLLGAVLLVLLSGCTNVANMMLARAGTRQAEFAIRRALGASRPRIGAQILLESLLLGVLGGAAGVALAFVGLEALLTLAPAGVPRLDEVTIDPVVLGFALLVSVGAGLLFGLAPALHGSAEGPAAGLRASSRGHSVTGRRLRQALVMVELALTLVLLAGAGLLVRSFRELMHVDPGFEPDRVLTLQIELPMGTKYPEQWQRSALFHEMLDRIARLPRVSAVTMTNAPPLGEGTAGTVFTVDGETIDPETAAPATVRLIGPDYFRTLGIRLLDGRDFEATDDRDAPPVAIVNETAARRWPDGRATGRRLFLGTGDGIEVVGIARDVRVAGLDEPVPPTLYLPSEQRTYNFMTLVARTESTPDATLPAVHSIIRGIDADLPIYNVRTMDELVARSLAERRFHMLLLASFSGMALVLAMVGVYGVMSYLVAQRTREIGVRMALGARPRDISRSVLGEALALAVVATAAGVPMAVAATRLLAASLYGVRPEDPWTYAATAAILVATTAVSAFVPARRAAAGDPLAALRLE